MSAKPSMPMSCQEGICENQNVVSRLNTLEDMARETHTVLRDIKTALVGNDELKTKGLSQRVDAIEASDAEQNRRLFVWGGAVTAVGTAITQVLEWLKK